jgi:hypothetical protein
MSFVTGFISSGNLKVKIGLARLIDQCVASLSGKDNLALLQLIVSESFFCCLKFLAVDISNLSG